MEEGKEERIKEKMEGGEHGMEGNGKETKDKKKGRKGEVG